MSSSLLFSCAFALVVLAAVLPVGSAIKCYRCSSLNDSACADTLAKVPTTDKEKSFSVDCDQADKSNVEVGKEKLPSTFCRKIVQLVDGRTNVIRACGLVTDGRDCYATGAKDSHSQVCQCSEDHCNSALTVSTSWSLVLLPVALSALLLTRN